MFIPTNPSPILLDPSTVTSVSNTELNHASVNPSGVIDSEGSLRR